MVDKILSELKRTVFDKKSGDQFLDNFYRKVVLLVNEIWRLIITRLRRI